MRDVKLAVLLLKRIN